MHAIRTGGAPSTLDTLQSVQMDEPGPPAPGEIQVAIEASSLNYHDYAVVSGMIPAEHGCIPLSDAAGTIRALGDGVTDMAEGDMVVSTFFPFWLDGTPPASAFTQVPGDGIDGYARQIVNAPAHAFTRAPTGYDAGQAATLTCAAVTAWRALFVDYALKPGDTVLVQGTGGVSIFALQFAKAAGARVIVTSSSDAKLDRANKLGADVCINYREQENWAAAAMKATNGRGVDCIVEVGGAGTLNQSMAAARIGGHIAMIGVLTGVAGPVQTALLFSKNLTVRGLTVGSRQHQLDMIAAIDANGIVPIVSNRFPLNDLADAFRHQETGKHFGKIVIDI
ncbi:MAG: NAD(P)-dependent alcohol dehydrogenase [Pontixanthobacter sp.]